MVTYNCLFAFVLLLGLTASKAEIVFSGPEELGNLSFSCYNTAELLFQQDWKLLRLKVSADLFHEYVPGKNYSGHALLCSSRENLDDHDHNFVLERNSENLNFFKGDPRNLTASAIVYFQKPGFVGRADVRAYYPSSIRSSVEHLVSISCDIPNKSTLKALFEHVKNGTVVVDLVYPDVNPFVSLFESMHYRLIFAYFLPTVYLYIAMLGFHNLLERIYNEKGIKLPLIVLAIQSPSCFVLAVFLYYDGWWSTIGGLSLIQRYMLMPLFAGFSFCTTILVYMIYKSVIERSPIRSISDAISKKPFVSLMAFLTFSSDILMFIRTDIVHTIIYFSGPIYLFFQLIYAGMFIRASLGVAKELGANSPNEDIVSARMKETLRLRYYANYTAIVSFLYVIVMGAGATTSLVLNPVGWTVAFFVMIASRAGMSYSHICMCRIPNRNRRVSVVPSIPLSSGGVDGARFLDELRNTINRKSVLGNQSTVANESGIR